MMKLQEIINLRPDEILALAKKLHIGSLSKLSEGQIVFEIIRKFREKEGKAICAEGVLEVLPDEYGFLRLAQNDFSASDYDIYVSQSQVKKFRLVSGSTIRGEVRPPKQNENHMALIKICCVNDESAQDLLARFANDNGNETSLEDLDEVLSSLDL